MAVNDDDDDDDTSSETGHIAEPIAKQKTRRSTKKVKYEEMDSNDSKAKVEVLGTDEDMVELGEKMEMAADTKVYKEDSDLYAI